MPGREVPDVRPQIGQVLTVIAIAPSGADGALYYLRLDVQPEPPLYFVVRVEYAYAFLVRSTLWLEGAEGTPQ